MKERRKEGSVERREGSCKGRQIEGKVIEGRMVEMEDRRNGWKNEMRGGKDMREDTGERRGKREGRWIRRMLEREVKGRSEAEIDVRKERGHENDGVDGREDT